MKISWYNGCMSWKKVRAKYNFYVIELIYLTGKYNN